MNSIFCAAELMFGLVELGCGGDPIFSLIYFSFAKLRLHTENPLPGLPGSDLKVCVGWWWGVTILAPF